MKRLCIFNPSRIKTVRIFHPVHVLVNEISVSDIDGFKIFKLNEYREIRGQIEAPDENRSHQVDSITSLEERKDKKTRTPLSYLIGGSQTLQHYQDSRTCSVKF